MASRTLEVVITGDARGAQGAFRDAEGSADSFGTKMGSLGDKLMGFGSKMTLGVSLPLGFLGVQAFNAASDLNESMSKVETIFGPEAGGIKRWAEGAAEHFGQSQESALDAAGAFGNMFTQLGMGVAPAAEMSQKMVELASDFASFHNADISDVILAQEAAFRGEYDAVQRFVPTINAAAVETAALAMTGKDNADQLTAQEKAAAVYKLMIEGAGEAQGDFARTADGAANKQRTLNAKFDDAKAKIGQALIPIFSKFADILSKVSDWFSDLDPKWQQLITYAGLLLVAIGPLSTVLGGLLSVIAAISLPVLAVAAAIGILIAAGVLLYTKWDEIWNFIKDHPAIAIIIGSVLLPLIAIVGGVVVAVKLVKEHWDVIWPAVQGVAERVWGVLKGVFDALDKAIRAVGDAAQFLWDLWQQAWPTIQSILEGAWAAISFIFDVFVWTLGVIGGAAETLYGIWQGAWSIIQDAVSTAWGIVKPFFDLISWTLGVIGGMAEWVGTAAKTGFDAFVSAAQNLWNLVSGPFASIASALQRIWDLATGLGSIIGLGGGGDTVPNAKPGVAGASGGIVNRPTFALIGEAGPEAVIPLGRAPGNRPLPSGVGLGGNQYAITVNVGPGGNPAETGRVVVEAIREYERRAGSSWRN